MAVNAFPFDGAGNVERFVCDDVFSFGWLLFFLPLRPVRLSESAAIVSLRRFSLPLIGLSPYSFRSDACPDWPVP